MPSLLAQVKEEKEMKCAVRTDDFNQAHIASSMCAKPSNQKMEQNRSLSYTLRVVPHSSLY